MPSHSYTQAQLDDISERGWQQWAEGEANAYRAMEANREALQSHGASQATTLAPTNRHPITQATFRPARRAHLM